MVDAKTSINQSGESEVTKVELFEFIRKEYFNQRKSIRQIAKEQRVHRRQVRRAIENAVPPTRKTACRKGTVLTLFVKQTIDRWLQADLQAPRKQRHTAQRIYQRLKDEAGFSGSAGTIAQYVCKQRKVLGLSAQAFIPQIHLPGEEAEVDWYEAQVDFPSGREKVYFFQMRACHSGKEFHCAFQRQNQLSFLEAHVAAFQYFGGVFKRIRYDNLTSAVKKVLRGRKRIESDRFIALRSHYLFESEFCLPGIQGAHEKGGVEGGVGRFRRNHLVPVPQVRDLTELNQRCRQACEQDDRRTISGQTESVEARWCSEQPLLGALPEKMFSTFDTALPQVNKKSLVLIKGNYYSVPVAYVGQIVEAQIQAEKIVIFKRGYCIAQHTRSFEQQTVIATLDHYLPLLKHKPGALAGSVALNQSRQQHHWPVVYDQYWQNLKERDGDSEGNRKMVDWLWWARDFELPEASALLEEALKLGCYSLESIQCLKRQRRETREPSTQLSLDLLGDLVRYERPMSTVNHYDSLLTFTSGEPL